MSSVRRITKVGTEVEVQLPRQDRMTQAGAEVDFDPNLGRQDNMTFLGVEVEVILPVSDDHFGPRVQCM